MKRLIEFCPGPGAPRPSVHSGSWLLTLVVAGAVGDVAAAAAPEVAAQKAVVQNAVGEEKPAAPVREDIETGVRIAQLLEDADRKRQAGQVAEALADLRAANTLIKKAKGEGHPDVLPVLDLAGLTLLENGQYAEAQNPLQKAAALREDLRAAGKPVSAVEEAASLVALGRARMAVGAFDAAAEPLDKAVGLFDSSIGPLHASTLAARERLAEVRFGLGDLAGGRTLVEQVLERRRTQAGAEAERLAAAAAVASARGWAGDAAAASQVLVAALGDRGRSRAVQAAVPAVLRQLAEFQDVAGDPDAARATLERAAAIDGETSGPGTAAVLLDRLLGCVLEARQGDAAAAVAAVPALVQAAEDRGAHDDPLAAAAIRAAAAVHLAAGDAAAAAGLFRKALELDTRLLGAEHPDRAADEAGLARSLALSGDLKSARPLFDHAVTVCKRSVGPFHPQSLGLLAEQGACAAEAGDLATAAAALDTLIEHGVAYRGEAAEVTLCRLADGVAALEERAGHGDRAAAVRESLVDLRQRQFGPQHERVADVLVKLAQARQLAGAHPAAVPLFERALAIVEASKSAADVEVAAILAPLATSYRAEGENGRAETALARGLAIWDATVGPDHPVAIATVKPLALVRLALGKNAEALPLMKRLLAAYDADPATQPLDTIRLLKKIAQVQEALGDTEAARKSHERAVALEAASGKSPAVAE